MKKILHLMDYKKLLILKMTWKKNCHKEQVNIDPHIQHNKALYNHK